LWSDYSTNFYSIHTSPEQTCIGIAEEGLVNHLTG